MIWAARSEFRGEVSLDTETLHETTLEMAGRERRKRIKEKESKIDDYKTWVYDPAFEVRWLWTRDRCTRENFTDKMGKRREGAEFCVSLLVMVLEYPLISLLHC